MANSITIHYAIIRDEKQMVVNDLVAKMNDMVENENLFTADMLRDLRNKIDELIISDF